MRLFATARWSSVALLAVLPVAGCDSVGDGPPTRAVITSVQIDDGPLRDTNGNLWDGSVGGGPDVYFRLFFADEDFVAEPDRDLLNPRDDAFVVNVATPGVGWVDDVGDSDFPLVWDVDGGFEVRDFDEPYRIVLYDYDPTTEDDPMISTREFTLAEAAPERVDGRTETIVLDGEGSARERVLVRLRVRYER